MKLKLDQSHALDRLRFDVFDASDIEEMVLVVIDEKSFHLGRVHAAIGLRDIENRDAEVGKDVAGHPLNGQRAGEHCGDDQHQERDRSSEGKGNQIHSATQQVFAVRAPPPVVEEPRS